MAIKHCTSFSLVFLATATILLAGQAHGIRHINLCRRADYPKLCRLVVRGQVNPYVAMASAINQLIIATYKAEGLATRSGSKDCRASYGDAISNLKTSLVNLRSHDKASLEINLAAALTDYVDCDDGLEDFGGRTPLGRTNGKLHRMASNSLYLASLTR
ncbi:pectinesterase inhibitor-like [Fagus crenata]